MIIVEDAGVTFKGCELDILDGLMLVIRSAHDFMQKHHDEEFANENITRIIKIALATDDDEEFNGCRAKYLKEMSESLCEGCDSDCTIRNPLEGLFDFLDGITEKADEEEADEDDEPEIEVKELVIEIPSAKDILEGLNAIVSAAQKKEGEE